MRYALLAFILCSCADPAPKFSRNGADVEAPIGFFAYCREHPARQECGGKGE